MTNYSYVDYMLVGIPIIAFSKLDIFIVILINH